MLLVHLVLLHVDSEHGWLSSLVAASTLGRCGHDGPRHQVDVVHLLVDVAHRRTKSYHTLPHLGVNMSMWGWNWEEEGSYSDGDGKQLVYLTVSLPQFLDSPAQHSFESFV